MILAQHLKKAHIKALRKDHRHPGADTNDFDMRDCTQTGQEVFEAGVSDRKWIAARDQYVANRRRPLDIRYAGIQICVTRRDLVPDDSASRAVAAIERALMGQEKQHSIRIPMCNIWSRRMAILAKRIGHFLRGYVHLCCRWYDLPSHRAPRVFRIYQASVVRRDSEAERNALAQGLAFIFTYMDHARELLNACDAIL